MNRDPSPALIVRFDGLPTPAAREHLVSLLADYGLLAIHEDDVTAPRAWTAYFDDTLSRDAAARAVTVMAGAEPVDVEPVEIEDEDWARRTQAELPAVRVGRVVVAPPWDIPAPTDSPAAGADVLVVIEPSRGFGTGHHQSTRLCLALLQGRELHGRTVLDVGTGSGVLAIVAAKLGAAFVSAIDVDADAVENARENIARNGVGAAVEAHVRDVREGPPDPADLVVANLTGMLLSRCADALRASVREGGSLIVAGFTEDELRLVTDAFSPAFQVTESAEEDGWRACVLTGGA